MVESHPGVVQEADTLTKEVVDVLQDLAEVNGATQADDIDEDMDFEGSYEEDDAALADTDNGKGAGRGDSDEEEGHDLAPATAIARLRP